MNVSPDVARYLELTREALPEKARDPGLRWPVVNDHCFQRIVLDAVCGGVWYNSIERPAYRHLSEAQARQAVALCEDILAGRADLWDLNNQSLAWRGKRQRVAPR
ncbi:MAG: hypothetical protein AAF678_07850 [Pseudomonadota bacterium]